MEEGSSFTVSIHWAKATDGNCGGEDCCVDGGGDSCSIKLIKNEAGAYEWETTCGTGPSPTPTPCSNSTIPTSDYCVKSAITDSNENDKICPKEIGGTLHAEQRIENTNCPCACDPEPDPSCCKNNGYAACCEECDTDPNGDSCLSCVQRTRNCCQRGGCSGNISPSPTTFREIEINTDIPYVSETWKQTCCPYQGFFNFFRPGDYSQFVAMRAKSGLSYSFHQKLCGTLE
jgi:hypothetical protein